jgi:hypothetical protein
VGTQECFLVTFPRDETGQPAARVVVKPGSVPDGVRAKRSESCGLW